MRTLIQSLLSLSVVALIACGQNAPVELGTPIEDELAPEFEGGGQAPVGEQIYPGPYGIGVGSVIPNYTFYGYPRASLNKEGSLVPVTLSDFYNPTGDGVYPEDSPYGAGLPKPKALVLDRSAVWCPPCVHEASVVIPDKRKTYEGRGGEFFVTLDDGPNRGTRATPADLKGWVTRFEINYPAVIDPNATLSAIVGYDAYPGNVIIRTKDMKIVHWQAGVPNSTFWSKFELVLNDQPIFPGER